MTKASPGDPRLERVTAICVALPEATTERHGSHAGYLIRKKHFAYYVDNHHGDGIVAIYCKVLPGDNTRLIAADSEKFYLPAYVGAKGWVALRLDRGPADWNEIQEFLTHSYVLIAPVRLARLVDNTKE